MAHAAFGLEDVVDPPVRIFLLEDLSDVLEEEILVHEGSLTMIIFVPSSVESCEGGHVLCHHLLEKRRSAFLVLRRRV